MKYHDNSNFFLNSNKHWSMICATLYFAVLFVDKLSFKMFVFSVEGVGYDRPWASGEPRSCDDCGRHTGCRQSICLNDNGHAKSFRGVCDAMKYLHNKVNRIVVAIGLGECKQLYSCEFQFWFCFLEISNILFVNVKVMLL